ncbi:peptidoglycan-binding protein [Streptomyces sp. NPDC059002]|uniref:peptidoglycan-binding domain-containing protein n=1 Tax=Streptomyces sp. NPDC059002 TaxID=3346690 RepID=UPI003680F775
MITRKRLALASATVALGSGLVLGPAAAAFADAPQTRTSGSSTTLAFECHYKNGVGLYCGHTTRNDYADYGDSGKGVMEIQDLIKQTTDYGYLKVDGQFGKNTRSAVKWFQKNYMGDNTPDGIVGPKTWKALRAK